MKKIKLFGITICMAILLAVIVALVKMLFMLLAIFIGYMWASIIYIVFALAMLYWLICYIDKSINQF